jgi:hypothetical protein
MQTATIRQREALAKSSRSEFDLVFEQLQQKWICEQHTQKYCYLEPLASGKFQHLSFTPMQWGIWATAILNGTALYAYPPRTPDFEAILQETRKKCGGRSKKSTRNDSDSDGKAPKVVFNHYHSANGFSEFPGQHSTSSDFSKPPQFARRYSDPSHSPRKPSRKNTYEVLKEIGYQPVDWTSRGLEDYIKWLEDQFQGSFEKTLTALQAQGIGLDSLDGMKAEFLVDHCQISSGDSLRIVGNFGRWLDEMLLQA